MPIKVLIVDDSALIRALLKEIIQQDPELQLVGQAPDAYVARDLIKQFNPDVITLDIEMPRMDGLTFLEKLMNARPTPVVMISSLTESGSEATFRAMELGAVDFVAKPKLGIREGMEAYADDIRDKIKAASRARLSKPRAAGKTMDSSNKPSHESRSPIVGTEKIIAIGASTGGTEAIKDVLIDMPADSPGIVITQHMPPGFTKSYATRLNTLCKIAVKEASDGERVLPGHAYIAPGGMHLSVERSGANYIARVRDGDPVNRHKPSVEVLFKSAASVVGRNAIGLMLTGMGADGAKAMKEMRDAGAYCVAQDEASCVVFGMPREAINAGACHQVLPLKQISTHLMEHLRATVGTSMNRV